MKIVKLSQVLLFIRTTTISSYGLKYVNTIKCLYTSILVMKMDYHILTQTILFVEKIFIVLRILHCLNWNFFSILFQIYSILKLSLVITLKRVLSKCWLTVKEDERLLKTILEFFPVRFYARIFCLWLWIGREGAYKRQRRIYLSNKLIQQKLLINYVIP